MKRRSPRAATIAARLGWFAILSSMLACSDGHLDAFSRQPSVTNDGGRSSAGSDTPTRPLLIDDFDDGDNQTITPGGWWYLTGDGSGTHGANYILTTTRDGAATLALRATGSGFTAWFFVGLDLPGQPNFEASAFSRVTFLARAEETSTVRELAFDVLDGTSVNLANSTELHFRAPLALTTEWQSYSFAFRDFVPTDGDAARRVNRANLATLEFWVFGPERFDFWLDELRFEP
jgi:hypothetical protein